MVYNVVEKIYSKFSSKFSFSLRYSQMSPQRFEHLLKMVGPVIQKKHNISKINFSRAAFSTYTALPGYGYGSTVIKF